jgi:hypothetical protein
MKYCEYGPWIVFTTFFFLCNLCVGAISYSVTLHSAKMLSSAKQSSLLRAISYHEENEVLCIHNISFSL